MHLKHPLLQFQPAEGDCLLHVSLNFLDNKRLTALLSKTEVFVFLSDCVLLDVKIYVGTFLTLLLPFVSLLVIFKL